jgi:hypothetical protein
VTRLFVFILAMLFVTNAKARPLSYPDGWMIMTENNGLENAIELNYTITPEWGVSYHADYQREDSSFHNAIQANHLLYRGNYEDSQANIYALGGAGLSTKESNSKALYYASVMGDWEDRRFYTSYSNRYEVIGDQGKFSQKGRLGIAPYIGDVGDLHTWFMVQADHRPENNIKLEITPLVRLFQGTNLLEIGYSNKSNVLVNYTKQF